MLQAIAADGLSEGDWSFALRNSSLGMNIMKMRAFFCIIFCVALIFADRVESESKKSDIAWGEWSEDIFQRAAQEQKLVLLDLEAVWCHWCHVMDRETYSQPVIQKLIKDHFIAVRVDQDARPDLSSRYRDYGWPATIVFNAEGKELAKRSGFIEAPVFEALLNKLVKSPVPVQESGEVRTYAVSHELPLDLRAELMSRFYGSYDERIGGLTSNHKFLDEDTIEYALLGAMHKQDKDAAMARQTLEANLKLHDPVWGGVYQYSTQGGWDSPHFEKIASTQAHNIRLYAKAYALWKDPLFLQAAKQTAGYLQNFWLSPGGAFYNSQDADVEKGIKAASYFALPDAGRRAKGIPAIDTAIYSRENGLLINALCELYAATGEVIYLDQARRAAQWILENRALPGGGFRHGEKDSAGPFLGDSLEMGRALLALYAVTGERAYLKRAQDAVTFIQTHFLDKGAADTAGFFTTSLQARSAVKAVQTLPENITLVRFLNLLGKYTGIDEYNQLAHYGMRYLATREVALKTKTEPGILLAAGELSESPLHITVVGAKDDAAALALFRAGLAIPWSYKRVEWWDVREGPMPNSDVQYPQLTKPAAFICTEKRCSLPIFKPEQIGKTLEAFSAQKGK